MNVNIIGIDCATDAKKVGLALGEYTGNKTTIKEVKKPKMGESVADVVLSWVNEDVHTLLAIDAPLGWPVALGNQLVHHNAGEYIEVDPNSLFRRVTDRCVKEITGKQSLDVGADRIARTAHAALNLLHELRGKTEERIPLAWSGELQDKISAIEVYPAATLRMVAIETSGYKKPENIRKRVEMLNSLRNFLDVNLDILSYEEDESSFDMDDDELDAIVCVLAGADFLSGNVVHSEDMTSAKKEGWIWVRTK